MWSTLVWSLRHDYNFELDILRTIILAVDVILEMRYDFELGVVRTTVSVVDAILKMRHYGS